MRAGQTLADAASVSVVLATHNGARYVRRQLETLLGQRARPREIIVSDDASSDDTLAIVEDVLGADTLPFQIARNDPALGFRDNFLQAARRTQGSHIAFCDQDDEWHADKLARCAAYFDRPDVAVIVHAATTIDEASRVTGAFRQNITRTRLRPPLSYDPWGTFWGFSIVFRRELLQLASPEERFVDYIDPRTQIAHDRWICFLGQMVGATAEIGEPLVGYRQHGANMFGAARKRNANADLTRRSEVYIAATRRMIEIVEAIPDAQAAAFPLFDRAAALAFLNKALAQLLCRHDIYMTGSRVRSLKRVAACLAKGHYGEVHSKSVRLRSIGRDLKFALTRA